MINFKHKFIDENGKNVILNQGNTEPLDFRTAARLALLYPPIKKEMTASEKIKRHDLAVRITNFPDSVILNEDEKIILIEAMGDAFIPVVVGAANAIINGKEPPVFEVNDAKK